MLLANYGSDSGSDSETETPVAGPSKPPPTPTLPKSSTSSIPQAKLKKKGPVKITLDLPKVSGEDDETINAGSKHVRGDDEDGVDSSKKSKSGSDGLKGGKGRYVVYLC
jgi:proline-rich protein PRCC